MTVKELDSESFESFVGKGNAVIDFYADWCGPCKMLKPEFEKASEEVKDISFGKVNVDKARDLAERFMVMSIPTIIYFKNGEQVERVMGAMGAADLKKKAESVF